MFLVRTPSRFHPLPVMMTIFLGVDGWTSQAALRAKLRCHSIYRAEVRGYPESKSIDLTWKKGWNSSSELILQLIEGVAFDNIFDASLKNGLLKCVISFQTATHPEQPGGG
jgi:hypothetical protein